MSGSNPAIQYDIPNILKPRTVCVTKRVVWTYFTYAPLVAFVLNIALLPGHLILFPYYLVVIIGRGRPPKFLYYWVYFNSAYLYGVRHQKDDVWLDFGCLYYVYFGFLVAFINWILSITSLAFIFPVFIYIEEWQLFINILYRTTFGYWKTIDNKCSNRHGDVRSKSSAKKTKIHKKGKTQDADFVTVKVDDKKEGFFACPVCGSEIDSSTTYCPKCGSYVSP